MGEVSRARDTRLGRLVGNLGRRSGFRFLPTLILTLVFCFDKLRCFFYRRGRLTMRVSERP